MFDVEMQEVDFIVLKEDYSRFTLINDGTVLKAKIVVKKIFFHHKKTSGYPASITLDTMNVVSSVPHKSPSPEPWNPQDIGNEVGFTEQKINTQEYMTSNGFRVTVKPVLTKVLKYSKFNMFGESIYGLTIQAITNIKKDTG